jgi:hypothetical protein
MPKMNNEKAARAFAGSEIEMTEAGVMKVDRSHLDEVPTLLGLDMAGRLRTPMSRS